ncbi:MAG: RNA polymerase sigma factor [Opitutaceae bacterium]|jgi:RNA polymerase sigma-70 factor (ECF subfamily)
MEANPSTHAPAAPASEPDDDTLARRAQAGERAALDQLARRHHPEVARLSWRFARRPADQDDLVQEVFLRVVRGLPQWRADRPFVHWLRRITVNTGRDYCRRESVRRRWTSEPSSDSDTPPPEAVDPSSDPSARAAASEAKALLAQLSPDDCTLLTLHHLEGWDFADIGAHLGWSRTATKVRAFRARLRLRALFQNQSAT